MWDRENRKQPLSCFLRHDEMFSDQGQRRLYNSRYTKTRCTVCSVVNYTAWELCSNKRTQPRCWHSCLPPGDGGKPTSWSKHLSRSPALPSSGCHTLANARDQLCGFRLVLLDDPAPSISLISAHPQRNPSPSFEPYYLWHYLGYKR